MTTTHAIRTSVPNPVDDGVLGVLTWSATEVHVSINTKQGVHVYRTLHFGDVVPELPGLRVVDISRPPSLPPYQVSTCVGPHLIAVTLCPAEDFAERSRYRHEPGSPKDKFQRDMEEWARSVPEPGGDGKSAMDHGGNPGDALTWITGMPARTATLAQLGADEIRRIIGGNNPCIVATGLFTDHHPAWHLAQQWGVYFDLAYTAKSVLPDGRIQLANPWGFNHPQPLPVDVMLQLFVGMYWLEV